MKAQHRKWLIFGVFLLVVSLVGGLLVALASKEPAYEGKKLSKWLDELAALDYWKQWDPHTKQVQAVRTIGTNALPWLLSELQADRSRWPWRLNQLLAKLPVIKRHFPDANDRVSRAIVGFQALGELAEPAVPTLLALVEEKPGFVPSVLASIGPPAVPALQQCLTNRRSYPTSVGQIVPIPGNTIGAIQNAITAGRLSRSTATAFLPAIRDWAQTTNRNPAQYDYTAGFLREFDH